MKIDASSSPSARTTTAATAPGIRHRITIDPITRLEGHGRIEILLNDAGDVDHAYLQVPELRGFEVFTRGRPAEDMPQITSRICGVCPTAHHMAATKALDQLYGVEPPPTARKIRELVYNAFILEDHALHVYVLGGPDFIVGPLAPAATRNLIGVIDKVGVEVGRKVIAMRRRLRELIAYFGGKAIHPVLGLPGGVSKGLAPGDLAGFQALARDALEFAQFTYRVFQDVVLDNPPHRELLRGESYRHRTYYAGLVDEQNRVSFYDGAWRIVKPTGEEYARVAPEAYADWIAEHAEPWSYMKFCYLRPLGWRGMTEGPETSLYAVAPLARLNAAAAMATPLAQAAHDELFATCGGKPVHDTLVNHWARVVEMIQAAETMVGLLDDPEITGTHLRNHPTRKPTRGIGMIEAPRGTLIHDYTTDERGLITRANLIVATQNNAGRIALGIEQAARSVIRRGQVSDGLLNLVEMAFRAYDPCFGCATHAQPGRVALHITIRDPAHNVIRELRSD